RHTALLHGDRDHLRHVARRRGIRAEPGVQNPRREYAMRFLGCERRLEPVARGDEKLAGKTTRAVTPQPADRLQREPGTVSRPQLGAEDAEREVRVREEAVEHPTPL